MAEPLTISIVGVSSAAIGAFIYRLVLAVLPVFVKSFGSPKGTCADHGLLLSRLSENTSAVKSLVARADKHHEEQRDDLHRVFEKMDIQNTKIVQHDVKIEALQEAFKNRSGEW